MTNVSLSGRCGNQSPKSSVTSYQCTKVEEILSSKIRIKIQTVDCRICDLNTILHSISYYNSQNFTQMMRIVLLVA